MALDSPGPLMVRAREPLTPSEAGKVGARARWGPTRRLNIRDLTPDQRRVVLALVDAQRATNAAHQAAKEARGDPPRTP